MAASATMATGSTAAGVVREARYIQTDLTRNHNKFWAIRLFGDGTCEVRWGRVGENGQSKVQRNAGEEWFQTRCRQKEIGGYRPARTIGHAGADTLQGEALARIATDQIVTACDETRRLVERLAHANVHRILQATTLAYDESRGTFSTPLGIVTAAALDEARALLGRLAERVARGEFDDPETLRGLDEYLMLIPQAIGRARRTTRDLLPDLDAVQRQNGILDALEASLAMAREPATPAAAAPTPRLFDARLEPVQDRDLIHLIRKMYRDTRQDRHASGNLDVRRVFTVEIAAMRRAYEERGKARGNVRLLWHGTRAGNLLSILRSGMVIPAANAPHCTGRMFGNGIYFSDQSTKSLNYASGYWQGAHRDDTCYMLLCHVALGKSHIPKSWQESFPHPRTDSTFAQANVSGVVNNEFVVYDPAQVDPAYLVEFGPEVG